MSDKGRPDEPVCAGFDWSRERYEDLIEGVVPEYRRQESLIAEAIERAGPPGMEEPFRILELGAGTGRLSQYLLETFSGAEITAFDVSPAMLAACEASLARFGRRARIVEVDFGTADLGHGYHAVVSRLAVHHLEDNDKQVLYGWVFEALLPGGVFVNVDLISGETEAEGEAMLAEWRSFMISQGDDPEEWEEWLVGDDDHPATERGQISWLEAAGFVEVRTIWKQALFALTGAVRPG